MKKVAKINPSHGKVAELMAKYFGLWCVRNKRKVSGDLFFDDVKSRKQFEKDIVQYASDAIDKLLGNIENYIQNENGEMVFSARKAEEAFLSRASTEQLEKFIGVSSAMCNNAEVVTQKQKEKEEEKTESGILVKYFRPDKIRTK